MQILKVQKAKHRQSRMRRKQNWKKIRRKAERKNRKNPFTVDEEAVAGIVSDWTKIPVQRLTEGESRRLAIWKKIRKLTNEEIKRGMCLCGKYIQYRNQKYAFGHRTVIDILMNIYADWLTDERARCSWVVFKSV